MKFHKFLYFFFLLVFIGAAHDLSARRLSANEALKRVSSQGVMSRSANEINRARLSFTAPDESFYVFNFAKDGYVIASGDDRVYPVLAEIPFGSFDAQDLTPGAKMLLEQYQAEISSLSANTEGSRANESDDDLSALYSRWTDIQPVMTCSWNQGYPYNSECPTIGGTHCVTGCVATAMAQVIRTIRYANGSGKRTLSSNYDAPVSFDYDTEPIDFDNLLDSGSNSEATRRAVARLMLACGLSVGMNYTVSESGAQSISVSTALIDNFGYDKDHTRYLRREGYSTARWESIVYTELKLGRPVYYSGSSGFGGHAFVVDGYKAEGLWHVNWGWGGKSDGYFRLSALNPAQQGTGTSGSTSGYRYGQALVKAVPPGKDPGVTVALMSGSISMVSEGEYNVFYSSNNTFLQNITLGAVVTEEYELQPLKWLPFWKNHTITSTGSIYDKNYHYDFSQAELPPGKYRIYPAMTQENSETPIMVDAISGKQYYLNLTVDASQNYIITNSEVQGEERKAKLYVVEVLKNKLVSGSNSSITCTVVNNGDLDYNGKLYLGIAKEGEEKPIKKLAASVSNIPAGFSEVLTIATVLSDDDSQAIPPRQL